MVNEERLVSLFRELCLIDAPSLAERESVAFVKRHLEELGLRVEEDDAGQKIGGNANNLIAWLEGNVPNAPRVFLSAHFDTVEPTQGLTIGERDGVFFSESDTILGADDKAGMAPVIEAVRVLIESGAPHGDVCLLFSVAEEIGLQGAAALNIRSLGLDFGYVLDTGPPVGSFVTRTGSHDKLDVTIFGKPAHAGKDPEKGINAIEVAAEAIHGMRLGRIAPETTANIGVIEGGTGTNIVCPKVHLRAEARSTSTEELDAQIDHMTSRFEAAASRFGARVAIDHERHYGGYSIDPQARVVAIASAAALEMGFGAELRTTLGGSDANRYNAAGVPCIVLGTGMQQIHTHDENVSREDLVQTARLVVRILAKACEV